MVLTVFVNAINLMFVYSWIIYELDVGGKVQHKQIKDETVCFSIRDLSGSLLTPFSLPS